MVRTILAALLLALGGALGATHVAAEAPPIMQRMPALTFTAEQSKQGRELYMEACAACHGPNLGGSGSRALKGRTFLGRWAGGNSLGAMFKYIRETMPPGGAGSLTATQTANLVALILEENGQTPGAKLLPEDYKTLQNMYLPFTGDTSGGLSLQAQLPPWPEMPNPAAGLAPVSDAMLHDPPDSDWLSWRRTLDGQGFSPLAQINRGNVGALRLAWSYNLAPGPNAATPLVHDGVIYAYANGDQVVALNAATGDMLWNYKRALPATRSGLPQRVKRNMALYGDKLYLATGDNQMIALDARTGALVWERATGPTSGGPLVVNGTVIEGLFRGARMPAQAAGPAIPPPACPTCGGFGRILGLDAAGGKLAWNFNVVPQPGEPGTQSWNDIPFDQRSGGSVWTSGYYDPDLDLVFVGTGNTYNTAALETPLGKPGVTNDALYTNSTLALRPRSGELAWYYQHHAGELWDLDWAFERVIADLSTGTGKTKAIVTVGKTGILDALDAATGKYLFSIDAGLQNVVTRIDPETGEKHSDPDLVPGKETRIICPASQGAKNWIPGSYDADKALLYQPVNLACIEMSPIDPGERSPLSSAIRWSVMPRPDSDGRYGRIQVYNLKARTTRSIAPRRAPMTSGLLATAGGVVFTGGLDRVFSAHDSTSGDLLWSARLGDVPSGAPISFSVDGKQYVAIIAGYGTMLSGSYLPLVPEISIPTTPSSSVYVFELPS